MKDMREALERIAKYPMTRSEEISIETAREIARSALTANAKQIIQDDIAKGIFAHWSRFDISGNGKESAVPAQEPVAEKATVWFNALSRIATLLEMPEDQPIIQAVEVLESLLNKPAQEPAKLKHHPICDGRYPSLCDACNAEAQEPVPTMSQFGSQELQNMILDKLSEPVKQESKNHVCNYLPSLLDDGGTFICSCGNWKLD
jgi:hypothetical protein